MATATVEIVACVMALAIPLLVIALPAIVILGAIRMMRGGPDKRSRAEDEQETRLIQEVHRGLERMGQRLDALETILFDERRSAGGAQPRKDM